GVSCIKQTRGSSGPKDSASAVSSPRAEERPKSLATSQPTAAPHIPRPTSVRTSRRVRGVLIAVLLLPAGLRQQVPVRLFGGPSRDARGSFSTVDASQRRY